jgi:S1-C subfamily serine protease
MTGPGWFLLAEQRDYVYQKSLMFRDIYRFPERIVQYQEKLCFFTPFSGEQGRCAEMKKKYSRLSLPGVFVVGLFLSLCLLLAGCQLGGSTGTSGGTGLQQSTPSSGIPALSSSNIEAVQEAVIAHVQPAVVRINVALAGNKGAIGSGDIIDSRGYIVTNNHVVSGAQKVQVVLFDGATTSAQIVGTDPADDLAVVKITPPANKLTTIPLGDSSKLAVGQVVLAIGNPLGITQTVTSGIISALNRNVTEGKGGPVLPNAIQTDAPINPGNSGGALVDLKGQLIGIPTLTAIDPEFNTPANGVGFAIPSNRVQFIASQIIQTGSVQHSGRAALGVQVTNVTSALQQQANLSVNHGAYVVSVVSGGPADRAGIKPGDVIVQVGSTSVTDVSSLQDALLKESPGATVPVKVYRGSQQMSFNVTLGELSVQSG